MALEPAQGSRTLADEPLCAVLDNDGKVIGEDPGLERGTLERMFSLMVQTRAWDAKGVSLRHQGRMGEWYSWSGQEAQIASAFALDENDWVFPAFRESGLYLARGLPMSALFEFWRGLPRAGWDVEKHRLAHFQLTMGTGMPHAVGFGIESKRCGRDVVALANLGDGSSSTPDAHAAMNFAGVFGTATVFFCANNGWAASVPVARQTAGTIADRGPGYGFPGVRVDGMDPLAVYSVTKAAVDRARAGHGPTLIEAVMYRFGGHAAYEAKPTYRPTGELEHWQQRDPIARLRGYLMERGWYDRAHEESVARETTNQLQEMSAAYEANGHGLVRGDVIRNVYAKIPQSLVSQLNEIEIAEGDLPTAFEQAELWEPPPDPDLSQAEAAPMNMAEALNDTLTGAMERDPRIVLLGEDMVADGGVFKVTKGLPERFGLDRVVDTPLVETGIIGAAVGMAMAGARPVPEIQFSGFVYTAFDQIVGHAARLRWRSVGQLEAPIVIRVAGQPGFDGMEFHCDPPEALFTHVPGLVVVMPSNPIDAKGLLAAALESSDPVVFIEPVALYFAKRQQVPIDAYSLSLGRARVARAGSDVTVVSYGRAACVSLEAAEQAADDGISVEVIDLRTLKPWDTETVLSSVRRTGRLVIAYEAWTTLGIGAEIAATVAERALDALEAPIERVALPDAPVPAQELEAMVRVTPARVLKAIRRTWLG